MRRNGHGPKWVGSLRLLVSQPFILRSPLPSDPEGRPKGGSDGNDWWTKWQGVYLPVLLRSLPRIVWMSVTSLPPFHSYRGANVVSGAPVSEASRIWKRKSLVTAGKNWTMMVIVPPLSLRSCSFPPFTHHSLRAAGGRRSRYTVRAHFTLVTHARSVGSAACGTREVNGDRSVATREPRTDRAHGLHFSHHFFSSLKGRAWVGFLGSGSFPWLTPQGQRTSLTSGFVRSPFLCVSLRLSLTLSLRPASRSLRSWPPAFGRSLPHASLAGGAPRGTWSARFAHSRLRRVWRGWSEWRTWPEGERQAVTSFFTSVHHLFPFCL